MLAVQTRAKADIARAAASENKANSGAAAANAGRPAATRLAMEAIETRSTQG